MKNSKIIIAAAVMLVVIGPLCFALRPQPKVLRVSIPCDSAWGDLYWEAGGSVELAVQTFERSHPDWQVVVEAGIRSADYSEWLMEQFLQGTEPDVFAIGQEDFFILEERGALRDLSDRIRDDPEFNAALFYPALWEANVVNGRCCAVPFLCDPQLMAVNDSLLAERGIAPVSENWTWGELHQKSRAIQAAQGSGRTLYGLGAYTWEMAAYANDSMIFNRDGSDNYIHETPVVEAVNYVYRMGGLIDPAARFENGNVAFAPIWATECRKYSEFPFAVLKYSGFDWHCVAMPAGPLGRNASETALMSIAIGARTRHARAAFDFLKILTANANVQDSLWATSFAVPALRGSAARTQAAEGAAISRAALAAVLEQAVVPSQFDRYEETFVHLDSLINACFQESRKLEVSLLRIHREIIDFR